MKFTQKKTNTLCSDNNEIGKLKIINNNNNRHFYSAVYLEILFRGTNLHHLGWVWQM